MSFLVPDVLLNGLQRCAQARCLVVGERALSFAELDRRADQLALAWQRHGLQPGERVALLCGNELEFVEQQVACMRAGLVLVPLNHRLAPAELHHVLAASQPRLLMASPRYAATAAALALPHWLFGPAYEQRLAAIDPAGAGLPRHVDPARPVQLLGTSGTTGRPKLVTISNGCLWARIQTACLELDVRPGDVLVNGMPLFHAVNNYVLAWLYRGAAVAMLDGFAPAALAEVIRRERGTHLMLVPTVVKALCDAPDFPAAALPSLRLLLYGAAPMAPQVLRQAMARFDCAYLQVYGMTETTSLTLLRPHDHDPVARAGLLASAGTDAVSFQTRIVDAAGAEVPPGVAGEITVRGPCVADGYWGDPQATAQALRDGWFHTGDIGHKDAAGYLYIVDRLKDVIVSGAENVASREVEDVLYEHPGVREAAVIGVPDARWGERVHAVVVAAHEGLTPEALIAHCRARLSHYKAPKTVELVPALPKNEMGKILKREVRRRYWPEPRQVG